MTHGIQVLDHAKARRANGGTTDQKTQYCSETQPIEERGKRYKEQQNDERLVHLYPLLVER